MLGPAGHPRPFAAALAAWLLAVLALLCATQAIAQQGPQFPKLTGRVVDAADVIPPDVEARLDQKLTALETQSHRQLVVATIPDLQGYDIADYGYQLGRAWGIGSKDKNDGALLIVAPNQRKLRIEVGYGLEGILTDGLSSIIINQTIVPRFKAGDMAGGIEAGTDAIMSQLTLPEAEAREIAAKAAARPPESQGGFPFFFFGLFALFFFVLPMLRRGRRGRRFGSALGPVILWDALSQGGRSGGSWGGGGFGGGGFSGGGGSFGGGGSSGSW